MTSCSSRTHLRHILVRHEQAAVHAAEGYARSTGKVGVVLVTSGPGATNAVTGLTDALMDSIPIVCLTGQVPTHLIGNDAFQEADTIGITRPCTKHNYLVKSVGDLPRIMHEAFYVARSGRPGPVVVDLPKDVQQAKGTYSNGVAAKHRSYNPQMKGEIRAIEQAVELMAKAKRPLFYCGGGVINSGPTASQAADAVRPPDRLSLTLTLMGLGAFPASDQQFLGMLGMHGMYEANLAMHDCDVMINIGARFDDRVTGRLTAFSPNSKKIHVDIDPSSINKNVRVDVPIVGDVAHVLEDMIRLWKAQQIRPNQKALDAWWKQIDGWRARDCLSYRPSDSVIKPQYALQRLFHAIKDKDFYITTEVGQHQMWAAQFLKLREAEPLDDLRRPRHHGLWPAGGHRRADRPSGGAGHRRRRRGLDSDEHPGDVDGHAVPAAGEDLHPEQPMDGHGAPVAGAAAWRALFRKLHGVAAGFREAGGCLRLRRPARRQAVGGR